MERMEIREIFDCTQRKKTNHKEYLKMLYNVYQKMEFNDFFFEFKNYLLLAFTQHPSHQFAKASISFASSFCLKIVTDYDKELKGTNENDECETHPFFMHLMSEVLKCVPLNNFNVRYHACELLATLFTNFDTDITISDVICDRIQKAMIKRVNEDPKPQIRSFAIKVLTRLQNPIALDCPVIQSFVNSLGDPISSVRKIIIENIAPYRNTFEHIIERLRDIDPSVRTATYIKLSKISPRILSITSRQSIIMSGLLESNAAVRNTFQQVLLSKWLGIYNSNIIQFMLALKLDANEEDISQMEQIYERLLPVIFKTTSLDELVALLTLNDSKVIPIKELSAEKVTYWCCLVKYMIKVDPTDMEFEDIIPPVVNIITCIQNFVELKSEKPLEPWEYLEYQQTLQKFIELIQLLDNSDEFGRQAIRKLLVHILTNVKMEGHVLKMVIRAFHLIMPDVEKLAYELCSIIADIKDPLEPIEIPVEVRSDRDVQIAQLKVKVHMITDKLKKAIEEKQFELVGTLSKESESLEKQIKELEMKFNKEKVLVRQPKNDLETVCRCLDIIISFIENVPIETLPNSLITLREEFLGNEEIDIRSAGAYQRIFRLSCLYSLTDKNIACQSLETICTPLIGYRVSSIFEKKILETAVGTISDLIRIYGPNIFEEFSTKDKNNELAVKRTNDRTLYCEEDYDLETEKSAVTAANATSSLFMDIMLSMLDDNHSDLRAYVVVALTKLVVRGLCVNASLITRLLLKWFNPILDTDDKDDQKVQRYIGTALTRYINNIKNAPSVFEKAIIPTLCYIGNAPKTSPLAEVNFDDVLHCLIKFSKIREGTTAEVHKNLAYSLLSRLAKTNDRSVRILTKMLTMLNIPVDEPNVIKELSQQVLLVQENITDKVGVTSLKKYFNKLNGITNENDTTNTTTNVSDTTLTSTHQSKTSDRCRNRKRKGSSISNTAYDDTTTSKEADVDVDFGRGLTWLDMHKSTQQVNPLFESRFEEVVLQISVSGTLVTSEAEETPTFKNLLHSVPIIVDTGSNQSKMRSIESTFDKNRQSRGSSNTDLDPIEEHDAEKSREDIETSTNDSSGPNSSCVRYGDVANYANISVSAKENKGRRKMRK